MARQRSMLSTAGLLALLAGCASQDTSSALRTTEINAGLANLLSEEPVSSPPPSLSDIFARDAADLAALQEAQQSSGPPTPEASTTPQFAIEPAEANPQEVIEVENLDPQPAESVETIAQRDEATDATIDAGADSDEAATPENAETAAQRKARLISELAAVLREDVREGSNPVRAHAALAALGAIDPESVDAALTDPALSDREVAALRAWRAMMRRSADNLVGSEGDATALVDAVEEAADTLSSWKPLEIAGASLCSRVEGYGRYAELPTQLLVGRDHPAIVYVELERFGVEPGVGPDREPGFVSRVTMELSLYHDADGLLAWRSSAREVKDFSRRKRRDFFLVQRVDLPSTLTVGMYRLKITVRDRITGAEAERIIPIDVVADVALIRDEP
jgi:hypothetical protein